MNPQVALVLIVVAVGYYGGKEVVHGVVKAEHAIVHVFHKPKPQPVPALDPAPDPTLDHEPPKIKPALC